MKKTAFWKSVSTLPELPYGNVHVWRLSLTKGMAESSCQSLSKDELKRADQFHCRGDRERFVCTRSMLRRLLSHYSGISAAEIIFSYNTQGKPFLCTPEQTPCLFFNVAHSKDLVLLAFSRQTELGVDIEYMRDTVRYFEVAQRFFSKEECLALAQLSGPELKRGFYRCWTRKEAFVKAVGSGLSFPFADFSVNLEKDTNPQLNWVDKGRFQGICKMFPILIGDYYSASLACLGEPERLVCYNTVHKK